MVNDYDGSLAELGKAVALLSFYLEEARNEGLPCFPACLDSRLLACDLHFKDIHLLTTRTKHMIRMSIFYVLIFWDLLECVKLA